MDSTCASRLRSGTVRCRLECWDLLVTAVEVWEPLHENFPEFLS